VRGLLYLRSVTRTQPGDHTFFSTANRRDRGRCLHGICGNCLQPASTRNVVAEGVQAAAQRIFAQRFADADGALLGVVRTAISFTVTALPAVAHLSRRVPRHHFLAWEFVGLLSLSFHQRRRARRQTRRRQFRPTVRGISDVDGRVRGDQL